MGSPIAFVFDFKRRGPNNLRRGAGWTPVLSVARFRTPRVIVSQLSRFGSNCELKRRFCEMKKRNMRRMRHRVKRST